MVEIGPGRGALTRALRSRADRVSAIEIDQYLATKLASNFPDVDVITGDFLEWTPDSSPYTLVGNIPFARSTDIVRRIAALDQPPLDAYLVVQREFAFRLCGRPFGQESLLSLELKPTWHIEIIDRLRRTDFDPPPKVETVMMRMAHRARPLLRPSELDRYREFLRNVFEGPAPLGMALRRWCSKRQIRRMADELRFELAAPMSAVCFEQCLGVFRAVRRIGRW